MRMSAPDSKWCVAKPCWESVTGGPLRHTGSNRTARLTARCSTLS